MKRKIKKGLKAYKKGFMLGMIFIMIMKMIDSNENIKKGIDYRNNGKRK